VRFSAVPGHVVTAIQSTVGMSFWVYSLAMCVSLARSLSLSRRTRQLLTLVSVARSIVSLPKQLAIVYLGYMVRPSLSLSLSSLSLSLRFSFRPFSFSPSLARAHT